MVVSGKYASFEREVHQDNQELLCRVVKMEDSFHLVEEDSYCC